MPKRVFVSCSHRQGPWVWDRLVPCLRAGGAEVVIDRERFVAGRAVVGQMDEHQDAAESCLLVLSPDYLGSDYCRHEMERAIARDPAFDDGSVVPVMRHDCDLPDELRGPNPLYVDLRDDRQPAPWDLLLSASEAYLGVDGPRWLAIRDEVQRFLERKQSVNLVVRGDGVAWRQLIDHLELPELGVVDLQKPSTFSRRGLAGEILRALWWLGLLYSKPGRFQRELEKLSRRRQLGAGFRLYLHLLPYLIVPCLLGRWMFVTVGALWRGLFLIVGKLLDKAIVRGHTVLYELIRRESTLPGLAGFRKRSTQRRRLLVVEEGGEYRLRVPLMERWLRQRG